MRIMHVYEQFKCPIAAAVREKYEKQKQEQTQQSVHVQVQVYFIFNGFDILR